MENKAVKIGSFSIDELKTKEGERLFKTLYRITRPDAAASWNKPKQDTEAARIIAKMDSWPKSAEDCEAAIDAAFEKVGWMDFILSKTRTLMESSKAFHLQDDATEFFRRVETQTKAQGPEAIALAYDALVFGVKLGAHTETRRIVEEAAQKMAAENAVALRGYKKMEEIAQDATKNPVDKALDIYKQMPMDDEARAVREAILNLGSIRKAAKSLGMNYNKARNVVQKIIIPAYAKAEIPPERIFLMRPSVRYRRTPQRGDDSGNAKERDLYQQGATNDGEGES